MKENDRNNREQGQSLVELALSLVMLLTLLAGLIDLGRGFFTYIALRDAAQEGATYASVIKTEPLQDATEVGNYCTDIKERVLITTQDLAGSGSNGPINLKTLADTGEVTVQTQIRNTECTSIAPADVCMGGKIRVKVTYDSFPMTMPFMGAIIGSQTITLSAVVEDMILTPACE